jgi:hypothetical protein
VVPWLDDPERVGPLVISEVTLAYRRLLERFGKRTEKLGHLHHTGTIRSSAADDGIRTVELGCECGTPESSRASSEAGSTGARASLRRKRTVIGGK